MDVPVSCQPSDATVVPSANGDVVVAYDETDAMDVASVVGNVKLSYCVSDDTVDPITGGCVGISDPTGGVPIGSDGVRGYVSKGSYEPGSVPYNGIVVPSNSGISVVLQVYN